MNDKIVELISEIDSNDYDEFTNSASINSEITLNEEISALDYSIINEIEKYLPFISNIVNLDYTNIDNNPVVLKSYENKFIKTLIFSIKDVLLSLQNKIEKLGTISNSKSLNSVLKTNLKNEDIEISININSKTKADLTKGESYGLSLIERIDRALSIINTLLESKFIEELKDLSLINGNAIKTEVFEQELNYRKSFELYEILEQYNTNLYDMKYIKNKLEDKLKTTFFLEYHLLNTCTENSTDANVYKIFLEKIIEQMVNDSTMDEKSFKKLITKKFEDEYNKKKNREKNIQSIFIKSCDNYAKQVKDALRALKI